VLNLSPSLCAEQRDNVAGDDPRDKFSSPASVVGLGELFVLQSRPGLCPTSAAGRALWRRSLGLTWLGAFSHWLNFSRLFCFKTVFPSFL